MEMLSVLEDCAGAWPTSTLMAPYAVRYRNLDLPNNVLEENKVLKLVLLSFGSEEEEIGKYL